MCVEWLTNYLGRSQQKLTFLAKIKIACSSTVRCALLVRRIVQYMNVVCLAPTVEGIVAVLFIEINFNSFI